MRPAPSTSERGILNPRAIETRFHLARHAPSADLAAFVERFWIVRWDLRGEPPHRQEVLPHPCVNVVIAPGSSAVHGVGTERFQTTLEGEGQVVGTKFRPGAFYPFLKRSMSEITDRTLTLREAFGDDADGLEEAVLAADDDHAQIAILEAFLRRRAPEPDADVAAVARVVALALEQRTIATVTELSARADVPQRTLQRLFKRYVGVSPKWVIRRFRIHEAAERAAQGTVVDWASLAHDLGYFDQAHFIKDFQAQVGRTPAAYAALCAEEARRAEAMTREATARVDTDRSRALL